jgi:hypothetical protein
MKDLKSKQDLVHAATVEFNQFIRSLDDLELNTRDMRADDESEEDIEKSVKEWLDKTRRRGYIREKVFTSGR